MPTTTTKKKKKKKKEEGRARWTVVHWFSFATPGAFACEYNKE